jgi:hypothetical protein
MTINKETNPAKILDLMENGFDLEEHHRKLSLDILMGKVGEQDYDPNHLRLCDLLVNAHVYMASNGSVIMYTVLHGSVQIFVDDIEYGLHQNDGVLELSFRHTEDYPLVINEALVAKYDSTEFLVIVMDLLAGTIGKSWDKKKELLELLLDPELPPKYLVSATL